MSVDIGPGCDRVVILNTFFYDKKKKIVSTFYLTLLVLTILEAGLNGCPDQMRNSVFSVILTLLLPIRLYSSV